MVMTLPRWSSIHYATNRHRAQDPLLFSGSVNDNIALTAPESRSEDVVAAAQIACAHEFIMDLPDGYSSDVGERGLA